MGRPRLTEPGVLGSIPREEVVFGKYMSSMRFCQLGAELGIPTHMNDIWLDVMLV